MNLDVIAKILVDAGVGQLGQTAGNNATPIFKNRMPATCTNGMVIRTPLEGIRVDNYLPGYFRTKFQIIVRSGVQAQGDAISKAVMAALKNERRMTYTDQNDAFLMQINYLVVDQLPIVYTRDDSGLNEWSLNFRISYCMDPV